MSERRGTGTTRRVQKGFSPSSVRSEVKKALADVLERKHVNIYTDTSSTMPVAGALAQLNTCAQGTTATTRVGNAINYKSLVARADVSPVNPTHATIYGHSVRFVIFRWLANSTPSVANVMADVSSGTRLLLSPFNHEYRSQFKILYDSGKINLQQAWGAAAPFEGWTTGAVSIPLIVKPLTGIKAVYDGSSSTNSTNRLYVLYAGDVANLADLHLYTQLNFTDA